MSSASQALDERLRRRLDALGDFAPTPLPKAAVLCPLLGPPGEQRLLFLVRPMTLRLHAGQIGFPGGKRDGAETPLSTALRECHEEVGVPAEAITVFGSLRPRASSSGLSVHCIVGRFADVPLRPDPREVVQLLQVPLEELRDVERWREAPPPGSVGSAPGQPPTSPQFAFGEHLLWGLTARFVRDLLARLAD